MKDNTKTYPVTWEGQLILACRKCQKKLKGDPDLRALAKLKKTVKRHNKEHPDQILHVINVPCMDLCPKDGVTVCDSRNPVRLSILRSVEDIGSLHQ
jgi:predicted metal-binding protein